MLLSVAVCWSATVSPAGRIKAVDGDDAHHTATYYETHPITWIAGEKPATTPFTARSIRSFHTTLVVNQPEGRSMSVLTHRILLRVAAAAVGLALAVTPSACGSTSTPAAASSSSTSTARSVMSSLMTMTGAPAAATATGSVDASSQTSSGKTVVVAAVDLQGVEGGWIAIHQDLDGKPGPVVGVAAVKNGMTKNLVVTLDKTITTGAFWPMLHVDDHVIGTYEFPKVAGADLPVKTGTAIVMKKITVTVN